MEIKNQKTSEIPRDSDISSVNKICGKMLAEIEGL